MVNRKSLVLLLAVLLISTALLAVRRSLFSAVQCLQNSIVDLNMAMQISAIVDEQRSIIIQELGESVVNKDELLLETYGNPTRSVIVTSWRSGSSFLGEILNSYPGNWYHYEPLKIMGQIQVRTQSVAEKAVNDLKSFLNCDFSKLDKFLKFDKIQPSYSSPNPRFWKQCSVHKDICWTPEFFSSLCKQFPSQSMKIVRLRLKFAQQLLEDTQLQVRMIYLVRDPRGSMTSRSKENWCKGQPDCDDNFHVCTDLVSDYHAAAYLVHRFPNTFRVIRYEELSLQPYQQAENLLSFLKLGMHPQVKRYLDMHTNHSKSGDTFRDSRSNAFQWKKELNFNKVEIIQSACEEAMRLWGYLPAHNETHLKSFQPMTSYKLSI